MSTAVFRMPAPPVPSCCYGRPVKLGGKLVPCLVCEARRKTAATASRRGYRHTRPRSEYQKAWDAKRREIRRERSECLHCGSSLLETGTLCGRCVILQRARDGEKK